MGLDLNNKHMELVDAINNAETDREHSMQSIFLSAWLKGVSDAGGSINWLYPDNVQFERGVTDRPMCVGVFQDWKEQKSECQLVNPLEKDLIFQTRFDDGESDWAEVSKMEFNHQANIPGITGRILCTYRGKTIIPSGTKGE